VEGTRTKGRGKGTGEANIARDSGIQKGVTKNKSNSRNLVSVRGVLKCSRHSSLTIDGPGKVISLPELGRQLKYR